MPEGVSKHDLGDVRLKDMDESERVVQLAIDGLPSSFPPLRAGREEPIDFGERLAERIEADVEKRIEASLTGRATLSRPGSPARVWRSSASSISCYSRPRSWRSSYS